MLGKGLESLIPKKNIAGEDTATSAPVEPIEPAMLSEVLSSSIVSPAPVEEEREKETSREPEKASEPIFYVEADKISLNPYQPRKEFGQEALQELAASIREFGVLQPLIVSKVEEETEEGTKVFYRLIAGQRRLMALKLLGLKTAPVIIRGALKKTEALEMAIVENIQREDLNVIETARAYSRLSEEFGMTQREIASRLGKSRESVANTMRLLSLPREVQDALSSGKINESQARLLMQIENASKQQEIFRQIMERGLSVREIKKELNPKKETPLEGIQTIRADDLEMQRIGRDLSDFLGAPVKVEFSRSGGKIIIHFFSSEEAQGIIQKIKPEDRNNI